MDPIDSGQGQETPSEQGCNLSSNSRGRQRKKNPKYFDYETGDAFNVQSAQQEPGRRSSRGGAASKKSPSKCAKANATREPAGAGTEAADETPEEAGGKMTKETPKKAARGKKNSRQKDSRQKD